MITQPASSSSRIPGLSSISVQDAQGEGVSREERKQEQSNSRGLQATIPVPPSPAFTNTTSLSVSASLHRVSAAYFSSAQQSYYPHHNDIATRMQSPNQPPCVLKQGPLRVRLSNSGGGGGGGGFGSSSSAPGSLAASFGHSFARSFACKEVILAYPKSVSDIHAVYSCMVASIDPSRISDAKAIGYLGNIGFASIKATPLMILLSSEHGGGSGMGDGGGGGGPTRKGPSLPFLSARTNDDPIFIHFTDIRAVYDEVQLQCACNFSFLSDKEIRFACSSSLEYLDWMKCVRKALDLACSSPHFDIAGSSPSYASSIMSVPLASGDGGGSSEFSSYPSAKPPAPAPSSHHQHQSHRHQLQVGNEGGGKSDILPIPPSPSAKRYLMMDRPSALSNAPTSFSMFDPKSLLGSIEIPSQQLEGASDTNSIQQESQIRVSHLS